MSLVDDIAVELADFHPSNDPEDREVRAMAERAMAVVTPELERLRKIEAAMSQHIDRACTCGAKVEEDGNTWHESRCPAVNPQIEEFFVALREALER